MNRRQFLIMLPATFALPAAAQTDPFELPPEPVEELSATPPADLEPYTGDIEAIWLDPPILEGKLITFEGTIVQRFEGQPGEAYAAGNDGLYFQSLIYMQVVEGGVTRKLWVGVNSDLQVIRDVYTARVSGRYVGINSVDGFDYPLIAANSVGSPTAADYPAPPPPVSGQYQLAQIKSALEEAGLSTEYGRNSAHTDQLDGVPGQALKVNGNDLFVFIFSPSEGNGPEQAVELAEQAYARMDPATLQVVRTSGAVIGEGETPHIFQGSNVIVVLLGGEDNEIEQVRVAIEGLV